MIHWNFANWKYLTKTAKQNKKSLILATILLESQNYWHQRFCKDESVSISYTQHRYATSVSKKYVRVAIWKIWLAEISRDGSFCYDFPSLKYHLRTWHTEQHTSSVTQTELQKLFGFA